MLRHLAKRARVVICGTASVASWEPWPQGPRVERHLLNKSARMEGFLIWDYEHRSQEAVDKLAAWIRTGALRYREEILDGLAQAPDAIAGLYRGENLGKRLIRVDHANPPLADRAEIRPIKSRMISTMTMTPCDAAWEIAPRSG